MKYTRYILNDAINVDRLQTSNRYLKYPVAVVLSVVAVIGVAGLSVMIPIAITMDGTRIIRWRWIQFRREHIRRDNERMR